MTRQLRGIDERRRAIVLARAAPNRKTYREIGAELGVGVQRVGALERHALVSMRRKTRWADITHERLLRAVGRKRVPLEELGARDDFFRVAPEHHSEFRYFVNEMLGGDLRVQLHGRGLAVLRQAPTTGGNRPTPAWYAPFVPGGCPDCTTRTADAIVCELADEYGFGQRPGDASRMLRDAATWVLLAAGGAMHALDLEGAVSATTYFTPARWRGVVASPPFVLLDGDRVGLVPRDVPGGRWASVRVVNAIVHHAGSRAMPLGAGLDLVKTLGGFGEGWNVATLRSVLRHDGRCVIVGKQIRRVRTRSS
jgi:hypothetical protein